MNDLLYAVTTSEGSDIITLDLLGKSSIDLAPDGVRSLVKMLTGDLPSASPSDPEVIYGDLASIGTPQELPSFPDLSGNGTPRPPAGS